MGTKKIAAMIVAVVAVAASYNVYQSQNTNTLSDLALANVEALANGETSEDFYARTGCVAVWENITCRGKDGNTYSYAKKG